jgi:hypothetical protein
MPGARRTRSLACKVKVAHECRHHRYSRIHPAFPHAMVLTAYFVLSPATNSSCHRHQRIKVCLSPVGPTRLRKFNTSNGCQDHTALPSAHAPFVSAPLIAHRPMRTRPAITSRAQRCRVHRIPPRVRDDRDTPLEWDETARVIDLIWVWREQKSFCKQDWTASIRLIRFNKLNGTPHGRLRQTGPARRGRCQAPASGVLLATLLRLPVGGFIARPTPPRPPRRSRTPTLADGTLVIIFLDAILSTAARKFEVLLQSSSAAARWVTHFSDLSSHRTTSAVQAKADIT